MTENHESPSLPAHLENDMPLDIHQPDIAIRTNTQAVRRLYRERILGPRLKQLPATVELHHRPMPAVEYPDVALLIHLDPGPFAEFIAFRHLRPVGVYRIRQRRSALQFCKLLGCRPFGGAPGIWRAILRPGGCTND